MAERQGYRLSRSRTRDPRALDYDRYLLSDLFTNAVVFGVWGTRRPEATIDQIEDFLNGKRTNDRDQVSAAATKASGSSRRRLPGKSGGKTSRSKDIAHKATSRQRSERWRKI